MQMLICTHVIMVIRMRMIMNLGRIMIVHVIICMCDHVYAHVYTHVCEYDYA